MKSKNTNGKWATFYRWTYGTSKEELPNNNCPYFWELVLAVILFPITWITYPWGFKIITKHGDFWEKNEYDNSHVKYLNYEYRECMIIKRLFTGLFLYLVLSVLAYIISLLLDANIDLWTVFVTICAILFLFVVVILGIIGLVYLFVGIGWAKDKVMDSEFYIETKDLIKERKTSFMEKHCDKIDWEDK